MDHKIVPVCLMTSRGIYKTLRLLAAGAPISSDREMAVVAALKLREPAYEGAVAADIFSDLSLKSERELLALSRAIHPVLCSLKLEKWLGVSGNCHYLAQSVSATGALPKRILLDGQAMNILWPQVAAHAPYSSQRLSV